MDIEEIGKSKKGGNILKSKGGMVAIGVVALFAIIALFKSGGSEEQTTTTPEGYDGYPQVGDNTESIMTAVNQLLKEAQDQQNEAMKDMQSGFLDQFEQMKENNELMSEGFKESLSYVQEQQKDLIDYQKEVWEKQQQIAQQMSDTANKVHDTVSKIPNEIPTKAPAPAPAPEKKPESKKPLIKSGYKGVSIVDALKYSGVDSSMANRKKLAEKMGIKGYKGTAKQNDLLLKLLREGGA